MRRLPAHIASMRRLLAREFAVELIAETLYAPDAEASRADVVAHLDSNGFDECGVRRDGVVREFVRRADLNSGTVGESATAVPLERVVAPATPLWTCMERLASRGSLYVLGDHGLDGIVTTADLNKQPARLLMFGIISILEMTLLALVRARWSGGAWRGCLTPQRIANAEQLHGERRRRGEEIDLADCLQLCDKVTICLKTDGVRDAWGGSRNSVEQVFKELQRIRDNLAHAQSPAADGDWAGVLKGLRQGHEILDRSVALLEANEGA